LSVEVAVMVMNSSRPYLIRALYEWIVENGLSPYVLVNARFQGAQVPQEHVVNDKIIFNVSPQAVKDLDLGNDVVQFNGRFSGKSQFVSVPVRAVLAIYAKENGRGMVFNEDEEDKTPPTGPVGGQSQSKAKLKLVK
jgi:stringent starvation protein B